MLSAVEALPAPSLLIAGAVGLSFLWLVLLVIYRLAVDPLRDIPGPVLARFTKLWLLREYLRGHYHTTNVALHKKYGPVVRIAPNQYSIDDPAALKVIYGHGSKFEKDPWYSVWGHPEFLNLFNVTDSNLHALMRRKTAAPFAMSSLLAYEPFVDECTRILIGKLDGFAQNRQTIDLGKWLQYYAFDVIGKITFSQRFGFMDTAKDVDGLIAVLESSTVYASAAGFYPWMYPLMMRAGELFGFAPKAMSNLVCMIQDRIAQGKQQLRERDADKASVVASPTTPDFVQKMLMTQDEHPGRTTDADIRIAAASNVTAGSDTTSITLSAVFYHLTRQPAAMRALRDELDSAHRAGRVSEPLTFAQAQELPYLQAVVKEALRVHPATGFGMGRVVPSGGRTVAGRSFPEGAIVGVNSWVAHANTSVWGSDAATFRPERWLTKDGAALSAQEGSFMSFGQGSRTCIGKNISLLEMTKVIPQIVRRFDFELATEHLSVMNHWFVKPVDFRCRVLARKN